MHKIEYLPIAQQDLMEALDYLILTLDAPQAAAELLEQATALMAQAKSCHDELETYYRTTVDFAQVDEAAARCAELFGLEAPSPDC